MTERFCLCADPENCTERVPGYKCKADYHESAWNPDYDPTPDDQADVTSGPDHRERDEMVKPR